MRKLVLLVMLGLWLPKTNFAEGLVDSIVSVQLADTGAVPATFKSELQKSFTKKAEGFFVHFDTTGTTTSQYRLSEFSLADGKDKVLASLAIAAAISVVYFVGIPMPFIVTGADCRIGMGPQYNEDDHKYAGISILFASKAKQWRRLGKKTGKKLAKYHLMAVDQGLN